jgi:hypothetical protein
MPCGVDLTAGQFITQLDFAVSVLFQQATDSLPHALSPHVFCQIIRLVQNCAGKLELTHNCAF